MRKFSPITFGYEWECLLLKDDLSLANERDIREVANHIRATIKGSETGVDYIHMLGLMLELRSPILRNFAELRESTATHIRAVYDECNKRNLLFLPAGGHPALGNAVGLHVHVGSIYSYPTAAKIANSFMRYAPCFIALAANSPIYGDRIGEFKSYRILTHADFCSVTRLLMSPNLAQWHWGEDVCVKVDWHSTIELRVGDGASSIEFVIEYVAFVTAFMLRMAEEPLTKPSVSQYEEYLINRWRAAKYGLQATFDWDGHPVPVADILDDMLAMARFDLIGVDGLKLIPRMVATRQTQADWQLMLYKTVNDTFAYTRMLIDTVKTDDPFTKYIENAPTLPVCKPEPIENYILANIEKETPYSMLYDLLLMPYGMLDKYLNKLIKTGHIRMQCDPRYGKRFTRV